MLRQLSLAIVILTSIAASSTAFASTQYHCPQSFIGGQLPAGYEMNADPLNGKKYVFLDATRVPGQNVAIMCSYKVKLPSKDYITFIQTITKANYTVSADSWVPLTTEGAPPGTLVCRKSAQSCFWRD